MTLNPLNDRDPFNGRGIDESLDELYASIDEDMRAGRFFLIEVILTEFDPTVETIDIALGLLTITLAAKSRLPHRRILFEKLEKIVADPEITLAGLEQPCPGVASEVVKENQVSRMAVEFEWKTEILSPAWMNLENLEHLLFSSECTHPEILKVKVVDP